MPSTNPIIIWLEAIIDSLNDCLSGRNDGGSHRLCACYDGLSHGFCYIYDHFSDLLECLANSLANRHNHFSHAQKYIQKPKQETRTMTGRRIFIAELMAEAQISKFYLRRYH